MNIHVSNGSSITVDNNLGNACNSGYWIVDDSTIRMNGNRGGHALSCIGFEMTNSILDIEHNGYAGVYLQSKDSSLDGCVVDVACNGENMLSYSAGDMWLNGYTLTVTDCTSTTLPGSAWLGAVGRTGSVETPSGSVVAHDLDTHSVDNLKSNCSPVLTNANVVDAEPHTLFLNPFMESDYARGNAEKTASNNDADLFDDDKVEDRIDIIGADNAKIGTLSDVDLAHHKYDWANGEVTDKATAESYGVVRYACTLACDDYAAGNTEQHPNSFDCEGVYVYAPLVGLSFDDNVDDDSVSGMPEAQDAIAYGDCAVEPGAPVRNSSVDDKQWVFTGWYTDSDCTQKFDFASGLTNNWTVLYAGWAQQDAPSASIVAEKVLNGADLAAGQFSFELKGSDGTYRVVKNDAKGVVDFGTFTYSAEGSYEYTVSEIKGNDEHVTYDESVKTVSVTITRDDATHALVATVTAPDGLTFTNTYTAPVVSEGFVARKVLEGATLGKDQFTFELRDADGNLVQTVKNDGSGMVVFDGIEFAQAGIYRYTISEVNDGQDNVTYDDSVKGVYVRVDDDGMGTLTAESRADEELVFTNTYVAPADLTKPSDESIKPSAPTASSIPNTGDVLPTVGAIAALVVAGVGVIVSSRIVSKRKN